MSDTPAPTRREVLGGLAAAGVVGTTGCLGDDRHTVVIGGTSSDSRSYRAGEALAHAASEHSDVVEITVQETRDWTANLYEYDDGEIPAVGVDSNSLAKAIDEEGPFADTPVETLPHQGFMYTSLQLHWVGLGGTGSDVTSTADLREGGYTIYPIRAGFATSLLTEEIAREADVWSQNEVLNDETDDIADVVEDRGVDALCLYGVNGVELADWCREVDERSDGDLYLLEVDDEFREAIADHPGAMLETFEPYGYQQDVDRVTDEVVAWSLAGQWAYSPEIPAEVTYEIARLATEHVDTMREVDPTTLDQDADTMTRAIFPELEVHEGQADFLEEHGAWNDDWIRGEAE